MLDPHLVCGFMCPRWFDFMAAVGCRKLGEHHFRLPIFIVVHPGMWCCMPVQMSHHHHT